MSKQNLYLVQDSDRPMHVIASSWSEAIEKWKALVAKENEMEPAHLDEPSGIQLICGPDEIIV